MQLKLLPRFVSCASFAFLAAALLTPLRAATNAPSAAALPERRVPSRTNAPAISPSAVRGTPLPRTNNISAAAASAAVPVPAASTPVVPPPAPVAASAAPAIPVIPSVPPAPSVASAPKPSVPSTPPTVKAKSEEMVPLINFESMPLGQVLDFYSELLGRTILRASSLPITTVITLKSRGPMTKSEAVMALEAVMAMNGITTIPVGEKFVKIILEGSAAQAAGAFSNVDPKDLPEVGKFVTQIVQLKYIPVEDAMAAIQAFAKSGGAIIPIKGSQTMVLRDYSENVKRMMEILEKVDIINEMNIKPEVIPIKYAEASEIANVLGSLTASGSGISVGKSTRSGLSGGTGTTGSQTGLNSGQNQNNSNLNSGSIGSGNRSSFQNRLEGIVKRASAAGDFQILGEVKIIADERTNSLLIFASDTDMVMIKTIIAQLDVVLKQVLIEAIIMEVTLGDSLTTGISYLQQPKNIGDSATVGGVNNGQSFLNPRSFLASITNGTGSNAVVTTAGSAGLTNLPSGFSYFAKLGSTFDVAVQAAAQDSRVNVLSRPTIQTSHAEEANLFIGDTIPYVTGTYFNGGNSGGNSSQYTQKEVGISLNVRPLINADGLVVMDIEQNIESIGKFTKIDNNDVPTTSKRQANAKVAVRDGETIVLGGFITTTKRKSKSGVPYLKDIPYLGVLFRSNSDSTDRTELMVFIRPTVLDTPEAAAIAATDAKNRLPGLKQGEFDIREEEDKRNAQVEEEMRRKLKIKAGKTKAK